MARPRLGEEERRGRTIGVRVTEAEAEELQERAQAARLSMGAYLRRRGLGQRVRMGTERRLGAAELRELNRIGVNLNQMARALNSGAAPSPAETQAAVERVGEMVAKLLAGGGRVMVVKMSSPGRSFGGVTDYCLHDPRMRGRPTIPRARSGWSGPRPATWPQSRGSCGADHGGHGRGVPELKRLAGAAATGRKLEKPVCHYSLNWAKEEKPTARDAAGCRGEPEGAGDGEAPGADRVAPRRTTPRACDREPGGPGERQGGGVEPEQAAPLEVGGKV